MDYAYPEDDEDDEIIMEYNHESDVSNKLDHLFSCDSCDKDFFNQLHYEKHMSEHATCNIDGCQFTAHRKLIEKHILGQHKTGLYSKIRNINTPEDIAKWIAERKKKYPTKQNVEKKIEKHEQLSQSGARIQNKSRFPRKSLTKLEIVKRTHLLRKRKKYKETSLINEKDDWNGNIFPFKGTSTLFTIEETRDDVKFEDDEWNDDQSVVTTKRSKVNNALGSLMAAYGSSDSDDNVDVSIKDSKNKDCQIPDSHNAEPPDEVKTVKSQLNSEEELQSIKQNETLEKTVLKKSRNRNRQSKNGTSTSSANQHKNKKRLIKSEFKKRKSTLLEKLLEKEIQNERNILLQCVRHIVKSNFFDN